MEVISGKKGENHYLIEQHHLLSNMEEEELMNMGLLGMEWNGKPIKVQGHR